ncbi:flagellar protein FlaG [Alteromonas sp. S005]|uniref:flagellar protein FlaG n=1 Tax=Alteromonas sp. S005 TaxID=3117400 RepID=UPI002FE029C7
MDIQNTVNGQSLAQRSALPVQSSPPERTGQVNAEQVETNKNDSRQSNARLNAADFQNEGGLSRNSPQGLREQADTQDREVTEDAVRQAISDVESFLKVQNRDLAFSIDEDTARSVVTVIDGQSGDVIRQIPSEEVLALAERIQELQQDVGASVGVFINNEV